MTPDEYCQQRAAQSGSSFYYSFLFLPETKRRAITALYAYCREIDDIADECREPAVAQHKLDWWREELLRLYNGSPQHPVTRALSNYLPQFHIKQTHMLDLITGMQMDLHNTRYTTFDDLYRYCYHVASVVGLMTAEIFGYKNTATLKYAEYLGVAFQLTNILRDLKEDYARDRVYFPEEDYRNFSLTPESLIAYLPEDTDRIQAFLSFQAQRALSWYDSALAILPAEDRANQRSGILMAAIYHKILHKILSKPNMVVTQRIQLSALHKLWIAWRTYRKELRHA